MTNSYFPVNEYLIAFAEKIADMEIHERLKKARELAGFRKAADAARALGIAYSTYAGHENGVRGAFKIDDAVRYAKRCRVNLEWLLTGHGDPGRLKGVPVVGYVGAGAEVFPEDVEGQSERVDPPAGADSDCVALMIRGDSMHPIGDGWLIFYKRDHDGVPDDCIGRLCVVKVLDGPTLLKEIHRGKSTKLWTLHSWNAPARENVRVEWAARVMDIRPR
jgi:transcriptional regulator with XRE-family HTH domain